MTFVMEGLEKNHDTGAGLNNMVVLSFLLHALILSIIFFSPSLPDPKWTFGPTYMVDLVSPPSSSVEVRSSEEISREVVGMNRKNHSMVMKKEVGEDLRIPAREAKPLKKEPEAVDTAIKGIKKRVAASTPGDASTTAPPAAATSGSRPVASPSHSELNIQMRVYYSVVWSMIKEKWALPEGILNNSDLEAVIEVKILKNGSVASLTFEKQSGNRYFDESALKAIKKVEKFPPLPEWLNKKYIDLGIRFRSSEL
ncbi:MAG: TonB C-terminal domain-containing protein [Deltaproteobacteria bacterium]|nr:TonB C-terminal domain-containing protein [Deltaproteobacteria bacterium]